MTTSVDSYDDTSCLLAHRRLAEDALNLIDRLGDDPELAEGLRLWIDQLCAVVRSVRSAAGPRQRLQSWRGCELAVRPIRTATCHSLCDGRIEDSDRDEIFDLAAKADRAREDEHQRLRRQLHIFDVF